MYGGMRMKRVTDPLDDRVKARIVGRVDPGYVSSGSEHSGHGYHDVTSPTFSELIFGGEDGDSEPEGMRDSDSERDSPICESLSRNADLIKPILMDNSDEFQNALKTHALKALQMFSCLKSDKTVIRRNVMAILRDRGYDAAICKTKWQSSGGLTAGNHEFIDVQSTDSSTRYLIDLEFASEFEIARPTTSYERLLQCLPAVYVGKIEDLKQILRAMSDAAKRSLKSRGLHQPPWRKHRFMQNKWLGSYRRTTNIFPASFASPSEANRNSAVKCRAVGFIAGGGSGLIPATARTR